MVRMISSTMSCAKCTITGIFESERCSHVSSDTFRASTLVAQRKRPAFRTSMAKRGSEDVMIGVSVRLMIVKLLTKCWKKTMTKMPSALSPTKSVESRLWVVWVLCRTYQTVRDHLLEAVDADWIAIRLCGRFGVVVKALRMET